MKKQNTQCSTFTSYLSKTNKNADMYRLYNPDNSHLSTFTFDYDNYFYNKYFGRHEITKRNFLTLFAINTYNIFSQPFFDKKIEPITRVIKCFYYRLKSNGFNIDKLSVTFRGGNVIFRNHNGKKEEISWFTLSRIANDIYQIDKNIYNSLSYAA
ncbi:TPA: hypothetical protein ACQ49C_004727 [Citrobacter freundii]